MKRPPDSPEFERFTEAMRRIMTVPKANIQKAIKEEKRKSRTSASHVSAESSKRAN
jgi:hypothetical protein